MTVPQFDPKNLSLQLFLIEQKKRRQRRNLLLIFLGIFIVSMVVGIIQSNRFSSSSSLDPAIGTEENIQFLMKNKMLKRLEVDEHHAYLDPFMWMSVDVKTKEGIAVSLAYYCARKQNSNIPWVEVYDNQSGKKLAKYGALGFEVF